MPDYFVDSRQTGGGDTGADRANAFLTLASAVAVMDAGDHVWVHKTHADSVTTSIACPDTTPGVVRVVCVDLDLGSGSDRPADAHRHSNDDGTHWNLTSSAHFEVKSSNATDLYVYGLSVTSAYRFQINYTNSARQWGGTVVWEGGYHRSTWSGGNWYFGCSAGTAALARILLRDMAIDSAASSTWILLPGNADVEFDNVRLPLTQRAGVPPTGHFVQDQAEQGGSFVLRNCDWSAGDWTGRTLFSVPYTAKLAAINCNLGDALAILTAADLEYGGTSVDIQGCRGTLEFAGNSNRNLIFRQTTAGTLKTDLLMRRTGGATDGVSSFAMKLASGPRSGPLFGVTLAIPTYFDATGSTTLEIEFIHDAAADLTNDEITLEVEYPGSGTAMAQQVAADRAIAAGGGTACATSSATWDDVTSQIITGQRKQKLSATFTVDTVGPALILVTLVRPNYVVWVCPEPVVA